VVGEETEIPVGYTSVATRLDVEEVLEEVLEELPPPPQPKSRKDANPIMNKLS
jgi:hypothetical protein